MQVSTCSEAPNITINPSSTDYPDRTTHGREQLLSSVPTSLTDFLYQTFITNFTSMYVRFENVTERVLESQCGDYPEDDDSANFECWRGDRSVVNDVDFLGTNLSTVLLDNPYLQLLQSEESSINKFVLSASWVSGNATMAQDFIDNIPLDLRQNNGTTDDKNNGTDDMDSGSGFTSLRLTAGLLLMPLVIMALML